MILSIGAQGFNCDAWRGEFYPDDLPVDWCMDYYRNEFDSVFLNAEQLSNLPESLSALFEDLDAKFYLFLESIPAEIQNNAFLDQNDVPAIALVNIKCNETETYKSFEIQRMEFRWLNHTMESAVFLLVSSNENVSEQKLRDLIEELMGKYSNYSCGFVFFSGALLKASTIKLAQTLADLLSPVSIQ